MAVSFKGNRNSNKQRQKLLGICICFAVIVFVVIITALGTSDYRKTVTVVRIKEDAPISANALITEDYIEPYNMYVKEFSNYGTIETSDGQQLASIVTWADRDYLIGQRYAAYYLRGGTVLFWDSTLVDQTRKNSYLYSMTGELLNIDMTTTDEFGDMVVPGDSLNIRASYTEQEYDLPTEEAYRLSQQTGGDIGAVSVEKVEPLFEEVRILDMLNGEGSSVFDIYYSYISATKQQQQAMLEDDSFLSSVQPASILLECTAEEVERYMEFQKLGATYQITLLPRVSSSQITDSLSEIQEALAGIAGLKKDE